MAEKTVISVNHLQKYFTVPEKTAGFSASLRSLVHRKYKTVKAVDDVTFSIREGEIVGFLGPNGAGKTTTLKMLTGILYPTNGTVDVLGHIPQKHEKVFQKQISLVMGQKNQLWWDLPATDAFLLNKEIYGISDATYNKAFAELTELLGVAPVLATPVRKLSLGQRMKCELIAALLHEPKILFLDEPTIGLDVATQKRVREFLIKINRERGTTIMLTSHYMEDVEAVSSRVIMINHGHKLYDGTIAKLMATYAKDKYLMVEFSKPVQSTRLAEVGEVVSSRETRATIAVPRKDHAKRAALLLTRFPVENLDIKEMKLEDVILEHFSK